MSPRIGRGTGNTAGLSLRSSRFLSNRWGPPQTLWAPVALPAKDSRGSPSFGRTERLDGCGRLPTLRLSADRRGVGRGWCGGCSSGGRPGSSRRAGRPRLDHGAGAALRCGRTDHRLWITDHRLWILAECRRFEPLYVIMRDESGKRQGGSKGRPLRGLAGGFGRRGFGRGRRMDDPVIKQTLKGVDCVPDQYECSRQAARRACPT
jgi:hypothetical protein